MALRDELVDLVDEVRQEVIHEEVGLRLHVVQTLLRSWPGEPGRGTPTETTVTLAPPPRVSNPPPKLVGGEGGKYQEGDRIISKISATYTADDLTGGDLDDGDEFSWLIDGEPYRVVGVPDERYLGWRVHLRKMRATS